MYNHEQLLKCFEEWDRHLNEQKIPDWDALPEIDLYMDQVLILINKYAHIFTISGDSNIVTPPMINNYVKHKTIPAPVKKKYSKKHIAYLIMVCTLKQALNISTIEKMIPNGLEEDAVKMIYNDFVRNQQKAFQYVSKQVTAISTPILTEEKNNPARIRDLVFQVAISANIFRTLTEQIADLSADESIPDNK